MKSIIPTLKKLLIPLALAGTFSQSLGVKDPFQKEVTQPQPKEAPLISATAPTPWDSPKVSRRARQHVLHQPIAANVLKHIPIVEMEEPWVNLQRMNHTRLKPMASIDPAYENAYNGFSLVRQGVSSRLLRMLDVLPPKFGIAYFEGFRPLSQQKIYFDKKFKEILAEIPNKQAAYAETCKHVSPFIDNIPPHATGAAIDFTLFKVGVGEGEFLDMGKFDTIFGPNPSQETFSPNTTPAQRENRKMLLEAAARTGLVNYGFEWWHFSYGDRAWAHVMGKSHAIYDLDTIQGDPILSMDQKTYLSQF